MNELVLSPGKGEIALMWKDLSVFKPSFTQKLAQCSGGESTHLITDCLTGFVKFGEMTAILGPSGAGKTSLLRCLYGVSNLKYFGEIFMNVSCKGAVFITQNEEDHILKSLTVEESLNYSSQLKCSHNYKPRVNELLFQLGLESCRNNYVKNCSGGQKKRLTIAQELTGEEMPGIVLMDEPTSGLDSKASHVLMLYLQQLCQKYDISIITTIHQPSYTLLRLFNNIYVMSLSGHFLFYGSPDDIAFCLSEADVKIPDGCNPADILLDAASITESSETEPFEDDFGYTDDDCYETTISLKTANKLESYTEERIKQEIHKHKLTNLSKVNHLFRNEPTVSIEHIKLLTRRMILNDIIRDPTAYLAKLFVLMLTGLIVVYFYENIAVGEDGCVPVVNGIKTLQCQYIKLANSKKYGLSTYSNFIFYNFFLLTLTSLVSSIMFFTSDFKIFINEHRNGWYSSYSHYIAKNIIEIANQIPLPYLYFLLISFSAKQFELKSFFDAIPFTERSNFKDLAMIGILATIVTQGIGFSISTLFSRSTAFYIGFSYFMANFVVSNFFIQFPKGTMNCYISYLTVVRWMVEASMAALYANRCQSPDPGQILQMKDTVLNMLNRTSMPPVLKNVVFAEVSKNYTDIRSKSMIYDAFNMDEHSIYFYYMVLFAMLIFWRIVAVILLKLKVKPKSLFVE